MRSVTTFTPYYNEDVTYSLAQLQKATASDDPLEDANLDLLHLLRAIFADANIDEAVARRPDLLAFIRQGPHDRIDLDESVAELLQSFGA